MERVNFYMWHPGYDSDPARSRAALVYPLYPVEPVHRGRLRFIRLNETLWLADA